VVLLLCSLCREAANRSKIRLNGGLKILLNSVREAPSPNTQVRSLEALLCFVYDEASLEVRKSYVNFFLSRFPALKCVHLTKLFRTVCARQ